MRVSKFCSALLVAFLTIGFVACSNTVSSSDASDKGGLDAVPGYHPGKAYSSQESSSSTAQSDSSTEDSSASDDGESSSSEEMSSSSEVEIDFSESAIDVDGSKVAIISEEYLDTVEANTASDLDDLLDQFTHNKNPVGFAVIRDLAFFVDDLDFTESRYFCFSFADEWLEITKDKLLETRLPFLWGMDYYDYREGYSLSFEGVCSTIYSLRN